MADDPLDPQPVLAALDTLLRERPAHVTHDFSAATGALTRYRDALTRRLRDQPSGEAGGGALGHDLDRVNTVISVVYGCHYLLREPPWEMLEKARAEFAIVATSADPR